MSSVFRRFTVAAILSLTLAACSGPSEEPDGTVDESTGHAADDAPEASESAGETDDQIVAGGDLTVVVGAEPPSLNPTIQTNRANQRIALPILEFLVEVEDFEPTKSGLITDWDRLSDTRWELTVREDVTFHNGEVFDAEAAVFSILDARDTSAGVLAAYFAPTIADATVTGELTLEVETVSPTGGLPELLALVTAFPPELLSDIGHEEFGRAPIGTGPFEFANWEPGQSITMSRYEDYWGGAVDLDQLTWIWASDSAQRVALIQTGAADIAVNVTPGLVSDLESTDGATVSQEPGLRKMFVAMNISEPPFDDERVRRIVAYALNRDLLTETVFEGGATPTRSIISEAHPSAGGHADFLEYDLDTASELFEDLGDVPTFPFYFTVGNYLLDDEVGEAIAGMLEAAGLSVERNPLDPGSFFDLVYSQEMPGMHVLGQTPLYPHEDLTFRTWFTNAALSRYCADDWITEQAPLAFAAEGDQRTQLYSEMERYVLTEQICLVPLYNQDEIYGISDRVQGFAPRLDELIDFRAISVAD